MIEAYVPILIFFGIVAAHAVGLPLLSHLVSPQRPTAIKGAPYESGMPALGSAHARFSIHFYMIGILFILFDIEVVFMIPWGVTFRSLGLYGLAVMAVFWFVLEVALLWVYKRRALVWE